MPTQTRRQVRFVTNRKISFGEAYRNTESQAYNPTAGQINIDNQEQKKSSGVLYPAAQLVINKDGDLQIELRKNPWRLSNVIVRGKEKDYYNRRAVQSAWGFAGRSRAAADPSLLCRCCFLCFFTVEGALRDCPCTAVSSIVSDSSAVNVAPCGTK